MSAKVVVPAYGGNYESVVDELIAEGLEVRRLPSDVRGAAAWTPELIEEYFADADAFVGIFEQLPITRAVFAQAKRLRIGVSPIIGTEPIDLAAASEFGVLIAHGAAPENYDGIAEAVVMLAAVLVKQLPSKWAALRSGGWRTIGVGRMMGEITLGMVGFGKVARATAERLSGFHTRLLAYDPYISEQEANAHGVELVGLETLLAESDVVAMMTVLTEETYHLIGEAEIRAMRPGSYLINTARGACVDEEALVAALRDGHLAGAAVDTFEIEPPRADHPLRSMPQVVATGHNVGHTQIMYETLRRLALEQLHAGLSGIEPEYVRNPEVLPLWHERLETLTDAGRAPSRGSRRSRASASSSPR